VAVSGDCLSNSNVPKLFFHPEPGAILANDEDLGFIRSLPALIEVKIAGRHCVQEDSPDDIGQAIAGCMSALS
jgi:haloalkane dehalogenase